MKDIEAQVSRAFVDACRAELDAPKPGNVHRFADGHGMRVADFERSAEAAAPEVARTGMPVGARIRAAVRATRASVGQNTNLGIVLLCVPLAAAAERGERPLRTALRRVLAGLDRQDAVDCFEAILLASPGGLGEAEAHNVRHAPAGTLRDAMRAAAHRDLIAQAYADDFAAVFDTGLSALMRARAAYHQPDWWPATSVYLTFLTTVADSHIARKFGPQRAETVRRDAEYRFMTLTKRDGVAQLAALLEFDAELKEQGINPGTCADLTVATLFAEKLRSTLQEASSNG